MINVPQTRFPVVYHRRVGDIVVTAVSDGFLDGALDVLHNIPQDEARQILADNFRPARRTPVNAFLIYSAGRLALMETGSGNYLLPTAGKLLANIKAAGVDPADHRDRAAHSHASRPFRGPDRHDDGQAATTPTPSSSCTRTSPSTGSTTPRWRQARERREEALLPGRPRAGRPLQGALAPLHGGRGVPGVTAIPRPGHTPGHTTFMISSGKEQLLIWGDTVHVPEVQTARPEVCMDFDTDRDAAAASRRKVFDMVATDRLLVTGMHLHFPGFAHLVRRGSGYQLIPAAWEQAL